MGNPKIEEYLAKEKCRHCGKQADLCEGCARCGSCGHAQECPECNA